MRFEEERVARGQTSFSKYIASQSRRQTKTRTSGRTRLQFGSVHAQCKKSQHTTTSQGILSLQYQFKGDSSEQEEKLFQRPAEPSKFRPNWANYINQARARAKPERAADLSTALAPWFCWSQFSSSQARRLKCNNGFFRSGIIAPWLAGVDF